MNDVFDEDLMKELGLDPDEIEAVKSKIPEPKKAPAPKPSLQAKATVESTSINEKFVEDPEPVAMPVKKTPPASHKNVLPPLAKSEPKVSGEALATEVPVHLAAVLGKKTILLRDVVALKPGEVIDFNKQPQDLLDLVANGKLVAKAELVLIDGRVGARIVKLIK